MVNAREVITVDDCAVQGGTLSFWVIFCMVPFKLCIPLASLSRDSVAYLVRVSPTPRVKKKKGRGS